jgi:hypothetical protein
MVSTSTDGALTEPDRRSKRSKRSKRIRLQVSLLAQARLRRERVLHAAWAGARAAGGASAVLAHPAHTTLRTRNNGTPMPKKDTDAPQLHHGHRLLTVRDSAHLRAADPIPKDLHAAARPQGRSASLRMLRDGLRPPLPPNTDEQQGWLSGRWLSPGLPQNPAQTLGADAQSLGL